MVILIHVRNYTSLIVGELQDYDTANASTIQIQPIRAQAFFPLTQMDGAAIPV